MPLTNTDIASRFAEMADLLELDGANRFRVNAYRDAAVTISDLPQELSGMVEDGADLTHLPGIGKDIAGAIRELLATGELADLDALRLRVPPTLREVMRLPGLGPKRVRALYDTLGVETLEDLERAVASGTLAEVPGFGKKTQENVRSALAAGRRKKARRLLAEVVPAAEALEAFLRGLEGVEQADIGGSYRRRRETVADLDAVAASRTPAAVIERFVTYPEIAEVLSHGDTRATVRLKNDLNVDLRVVEPISYGAALLYFTGAKDNNVALRGMAIDRGWKMNEYGLFDTDDRPIAQTTEAEIFAAYGMAYIEPELREHRGELAAAANGTLPTLIKQADIRGDLHCHSSWSDGRASIAEMAQGAIARGYEYIAITDHSQRLRMANGLDAGRLRQQAAEIAEVQARFPEIALLRGVEVDILKDGTLDLPDDILAELDIVVASVHSSFQLDRDEQTARLIRAVEHPAVTTLGHPSGRLIERREGITFDLEAVLAAAKTAGCAMELNADPHRLDLDDRALIVAKRMGVPIIVSTDAHGVNGFDLMRFGIWQARRGWLEASDVLNTLPLEALRARLRGG